MKVLLSKDDCEKLVLEGLQIKFPDYIITINNAGINSYNDTEFTLEQSKQIGEKE